MQISRGLCSKILFYYCARASCSEYLVCANYVANLWNSFSVQLLCRLTEMGQILLWK